MNDYELILKKLGLEDNHEALCITNTVSTIHPEPDHDNNRLLIGALSFCFDVPKESFFEALREFCPNDPALTKEFQEHAHRHGGSIRKILKEVQTCSA
jgi:hypothetical protein